MSSEDEDLNDRDQLDHGNIKGAAEVPLNLDSIRSSDRPVQSWTKLRSADASGPRQRGREQCGELLVEFKWLPPTEAAELRDSSDPRSCLPSVSRPASPGDAAPQPGNDAKRMILVGQLSRLRSTSSELRRAAIQSLAGRAGRNGTNLPKSGDWLRTLVASFSERIAKDPDADVRVEALHGLVMISHVDNPAVIRVVAAATRDPSRDVRHAAVGAMLQLARSGDEAAIAAVADRLEDGDHRVRTFAGQVPPSFKLSLPTTATQMITDDRDSDNYQ